MKAEGSRREAQSTCINSFLLKLTGAHLDVYKPRTLVKQALSLGTGHWLRDAHWICKCGYENVFYVGLKPVLLCLTCASFAFWHQTEWISSCVHVQRSKDGDDDAPQTAQRHWKAWLSNGKPSRRAKHQSKSREMARHEKDGRANHQENIFMVAQQRHSYCHLATPSRPRGCRN